MPTLKKGGSQPQAPSARQRLEMAASHAAERRWDRAEAELREVDPRRLDAYDRARYHLLSGYALIAAGREVAGYGQMGAGVELEIGAGERIPADPAFDWERVEESARVTALSLRRRKKVLAFAVTPDTPLAEAMTPLAKEQFVAMGRAMHMHGQSARSRDGLCPFIARECLGKVRHHVARVSFRARSLLERIVGEGGLVRVDRLREAEGGHIADEAWEMDPAPAPLGELRRFGLAALGVTVEGEGSSPVEAVIVPPDVRARLAEPVWLADSPDHAFVTRYLDEMWGDRPGLIPWVSLCAGALHFYGVARAGDLVVAVAAAVDGARARGVALPAALRDDEAPTADDLVLPIGLDPRCRVVWGALPPRPPRKPGKAYDPTPSDEFVLASVRVPRPEAILAARRERSIESLAPIDFQAIAAALIGRPDIGWSPDERAAADELLRLAGGGLDVADLLDFQQRMREGAPPAASIGWLARQVRFTSFSALQRFANAASRLWNQTPDWSLGGRAPVEVVRRRPLGGR